MKSLRIENSAVCWSGPPAHANGVAQRRVLLAIESSSACGRGSLRGIAAYMRANSKWQLIHWDRAISESLADFIEGWARDGQPFDGVVCGLANSADKSTIAALQLPTVDLMGPHPVACGAVLETDPEATATLAVEHLLERGYRNLAYCGRPRRKLSRRREQAFDEIVRARSLEPLPGLRAASADEFVGRSPLPKQRDLTDADELVSWLRELPKPVGVLACDDHRGRQVIDACDWAGVRVPEEVAVVGVGNDEVVCELSDPPLTSVVPDTLRLGYEAARLLDQMMTCGVRPPREPILIRPKCVHMRLSSDYLAVGDNDFAAALRFIREHACSGINVGDVVNCCQISRSTLERRFLKYLGFGPKEFILRMRFERVKALLRETDCELFQVARLTGFRTTAHLVSSFKIHTGETPGQYRREVREPLTGNVPVSAGRVLSAG